MKEPQVLTDKSFTFKLGKVIEYRRDRNHLFFKNDLKLKLFNRTILLRWEPTREDITPDVYNLVVYRNHKVIMRKKWN